MKIGIVKKFGLKKRDGDGIQFGFLTEAGGGEDGIYFNEKRIDPASKFMKHNRKGCLVVYDVKRFKNGKSEAFGIRLLTELDGKEQLSLYRECRDGNRDAELELLLGRRLHPGKERGGEELRTVKNFGLINKQGECYGFLAGNSPEEGDIYFNEKRIDPASKVRTGSLVVCDVRQLKNNRIEAFNIRLPKKLDAQEQLRLYRKLRRENRSRELTQLLYSVPELLDQESDEDIILLILMIKTGKGSAYGILQRRPELL